MVKKQTSKDKMLAHSQAKIDYHQKYLTHYHSFMSLANKNQADNGPAVLLL